MLKHFKKKYLIGFLYQALEDKLINIKNIVIKHSESADFSGTKTFKTDENLSFSSSAWDTYMCPRHKLHHMFTLFFSAFIDEMRDEVENMPGDLAPSKIVHDEKRLDRVLKENRALVMRCKELEIKLESR